jgi:hypothetical protein
VLGAVPVPSPQVRAGAADALASTEDVR